MKLKANTCSGSHAPLADVRLVCLNFRAEMKRHFARTNFNETSSRSHTVFGTNLECTQTYADGSVIVRRGELKLVDLAGNERATASEGVEGAKVGKPRNVFRNITV